MLSKGDDPVRCNLPSVLSYARPEQSGHYSDRDRRVLCRHGAFDLRGKGRCVRAFPRHLLTTIDACVSKRGTVSQPSSIERSDTSFIFFSSDQHNKCAFHSCVAYRKYQWERKYPVIGLGTGNFWSRNLFSPCFI